MSARRGGLGRGLGALLPTAAEGEQGDGTAAVPTALDRADEGSAPAPPGGAVLVEVDLDAVSPNPRQPREEFDEAALQELVASIRTVGVLQPIVVRPLPGGGYQLVMGERRWRAARLAGLTSMPAIVRDTPDVDLLRDALLENLHRQQLNPLEEAAAYQQLLAEFGATHDELAARLGRSRPQISNTLRLLHLPPAVQRRVAAGVLSAGHARALLGLPSAAEQEELAGRIVAEGLSVRAVEEIVAVGLPAPGRRVAARSRREPPPLAAAATQELSEWLDTRVRVEVGRGRGKITVEFADEEDLARILGQLRAGTAAGSPDAAAQEPRSVDGVGAAVPGRP